MKLMHWAAIAALLLCAPVFGQQSIVVPGAPAQTIQVPQDPAIAPLQKAVADQKAAIEAQAKQLAELQALIAPPPPAKDFPVLLSVDPRKGLSAQTSAIGLEAYGITSSVASAGAAFPSTTARIAVSNGLFTIAQQASDPKTANGSRTEFSFYNPTSGRPASDVIHVSGFHLRPDVWGSSEAIFFQIHSTGASPNPPITLAGSGGRITVSARYSITDPTTQVSVRSAKQLATLTVGKRYYVEVVYRLSATSGFFRIYVDGALVDSYSGPFGYVRGFHYRKQGLYDWTSSPTTHAITTTGPRDVIVADEADIDAARAAVKRDRDAVWQQ